MVKKKIPVGSRDDIVMEDTCGGCSEVLLQIKSTVGSEGVLT